MNSKLTIFLLSQCLTLISCATSGLLKQEDYQEARVQLEKPASISQAIEKFPQKYEQGGFITSLERAWLHLLNGQSDPNSLLRISEDLDRREMILISKEAHQFFFYETEEGYYPAEHEIIWLHLITGLGFAAKGDFISARVEAKRAANRLQGHEDSRTGDFDDPSLRLLLASLWLAVDEWEDARVDLRVAARLDPNLIWAKEIAEAADPPAAFHVFFEGRGPEPIFRPESLRGHLTGADSLKWPLKQISRPLLLSNSGKAKPASSLSTAEFYVRHQKRNTAIRETLENSKYMVKMGAVQTRSAAETGLISSIAGSGFVLAGAIMVGTVALVVAILANTSSSTGDTSELLGYILAGGIGLGIKLGQDSKNYFSSEKHRINEEKQRDLDLAKSYRFVRFIPDFMSFAANTKDIQARLTDTSGLAFRPFLEIISPKQGTRLFFYDSP